MRTWGEIDLVDVHEDDILDRDKAIVELWDSLKHYVTIVGQTYDLATPQEVLGDHVILDRYREFVERSRS